MVVKRKVVAKKKTVEEAIAEMPEVKENPPIMQVVTEEVEASQPVPAPEPVAEKEKEEIVEELFKPTTEAPILPDITVHEKKFNPKALIWILIMLLSAGLISFILLGATKKLPKLGISKPEPTPTVLPTSTPVPPKREELTIEVVNGGGTPGAGSKMKKFLEEKGYQVESVSNAEEYTFETTEIQVKPGKEAYLALLAEDLKADYTLGSSSANLASESSADARVIVGK